LCISIPDSIVTDDKKFNQGTQLAALAYENEKSILYLRTKYEYGDVDMAFAIAHELRHKYQIDTHVFDFDNYKTSNELSIREYNLQNEEIDANAYAYIVLLDFFKLKVDFKLLLKDDVVADTIMKRVDVIVENEYEYE
uniref:hypothetical protein n=1 Tax=Faecalibacillus intestinalis TaxID=1982626 RepID=UPI0018ABA2C2